MCYVPLIYSSSLMVFTTVSIIFCIFSFSLVSLSDMPLLKPSFFQLGVFLSSLPGFLTIWSYHILIWSKLRGQKNITGWIAMSFCMGIISQISLLLFGMVPSEQDLVSNSAMKTQENIFLLSFFLSSVVYESFTMTLLLQSKSSQIIHHDESWVTAKIALLIVIFMVSSAQLLMLMYLNVYKVKAAIEISSKIIGYIAFFLHVIYSGSYYWDLKQITFTINFGLDESEEQSLNSSTF